MSKRQQVIDAFLNQPQPAQVYLAEVLTVDERWCSVRLIHSDLEVDGVALVGEEDAGDFVTFIPKIGSLALVGMVENQLSNLYIAMAGEIDGVLIRVGKTEIKADKSAVSIITDKSKVVLDANKAVLSQGDTTVELQGKKVKVSNGTISLKGLFDDLTTLLNSLIVVTPAGPSTALGPNSIIAVTNLKTKVSQLLS